MKKLFVLFAISVSLFFSACTNNDQDISPVSAQFDKPSSTVSYPFNLYQNFPELAGAEVSWTGNAKGLEIRINIPTTNKGDMLFAVIEYADVDPIMQSAQMVYLGKAVRSNFLIGGIENRLVSSVKVYSSSSSRIVESSEPYPESQLFSSIIVDGWSDGYTSLKVSIAEFPFGMEHCFAELITSKSNILVFLGKPETEEFVFPKPPEIKVKAVRLMGYNPNPVLDPDS